MSTKNILLSCCFYVAILALLVTLPGTDSQVPGGKRQYITFYGQMNCSNNSIIGTVYDSSTNLSQSSYRNASALRINGLWVIAYNNISTPDAARPEGNCVPHRYPNNYNATYSSVTRVGGSNQDDVEFALYTGRYFQGTVYTVTNMGRTFPSPIAFNSWYFTGANYWTLYTGTNYNGTSTCMKPESIIENRKYGVNYMENVALTVGSVKYGCTGGGGGGGGGSGGNNTASAVNVFNTLSVITTATLVYATL